MLGKSVEERSCVEQMPVAVGLLAGPWGGWYSSGMVMAGVSSARLRILVCVVFVSVFNLLAVVSAQRPFTIGISDDPPYEYVLENGTIAGISTEIISEVLKEMNVSEFKITPYPWKRALAYLAEGRIHALCSIAKTEERARVYYYPEEPLMETKWVFFIREEERGRLKYSSLDDLRGKKIGVVRGYKYTPAFWEFLQKEQNYEEVTVDEQNFKKLEAGRIDYALGEYATGLFFAKKLGIEKRIFALIETPFEVVSLYAAFSKNGVPKEFVEAFSNKLKEFKRGKKYQEILEKYIPVHSCFPVLDFERRRPPDQQCHPLPAALDHLP